MTAGAGDGTTAGEPGPPVHGPGPDGTAVGDGGPGEAPQAPEVPEEPVRTFRRVFAYLAPYRWLFALSLLCMVAAAVFDAFSLVLLIPFLRALFGEGTALPAEGRSPAEDFIDWAVGDLIGTGTDLEVLRNVVLVVLAALVLKNAFLYAAKLLGVVVQERIERDMRDDVYGHLQLLPLGFFDDTKAGQLIARVLNDTRETKRIVSYALADAVRQLVTAIAYLAAMLAISWMLTLLALVLAPVLVLVLRPILKRLRSGFRRVYDRQGELVSILQETVSGIRLVKAYGAEDYERERFQEASDDFARGMIRTEGLYQLASPLSEVLSALVALALLWIGANLVLGVGVLGPEQFLTFVAIALRLISPVKAIADFPARAQSSLAAADRFLEVVDARPEPLEAPALAPAGGAGAPTGGVATGRAGPRAGAGPGASREPAAFRDGIEFREVTFSYEEGRPVLRDVDLRVGRGEMVALVGPSGAGKSTLVDLLPRFIEPDRGRILLDGRDLREIPLVELRELMGIVSQETVIFHDSVRANIAYGAPHRWSEDEVWEAARAAHADEFIRELPEGMDTPLGDRGVRLSGGQRQRIGIARAVLRDPPILILDEATSHLDSESERLVQEAMEDLVEGRTVFVIAHRLSTVLSADRIVVLREGRIVEQGTHGQLQARDGFYRRIYEMQFAGDAAAPPG